MDIPEDEYLAHYSVLGMHWGIQQRSSKGGTLHRSAKLDMNARSRDLNQLTTSGKKYRPAAAVLKAFMGKEAFDRRMNDQISDLNAQDARIRSGRVTIEDRLGMALTVPIADLVVSRTPDTSRSRLITGR